MSIAVPDAKLIKEAELQVNEAEYAGAWSTYREFRESVDDADHDGRTLRVLDRAERAAEVSFRAGAMGLESRIRTLLFVARRLAEAAEAEASPLRETGPQGSRCALGSALPTFTTRCDRRSRSVRPLPENGSALAIVIALGSKGTATSALTSEPSGPTNRPSSSLSSAVDGRTDVPNPLT